MQRLVETAPALASRNPTLEQGVVARTSLQLQDETGGVVGTRLAKGKAAAGRVGKEGRVVTLLGIMGWAAGYLGERNGGRTDTWRLKVPQSMHGDLQSGGRYYYYQRWGEVDLLLLLSTGLKGSAMKGEEGLRISDDKER